MHFFFYRLDTCILYIPKLDDTMYICHIFIRFMLKKNSFFMFKLPKIVFGHKRTFYFSTDDYSILPNILSDNDLTLTSHHVNKIFLIYLEFLIIYGHML